LTLLAYEKYLKTLKNINFKKNYFKKKLLKQKKNYKVKFATVIWPNIEGIWFVLTFVEGRQYNRPNL
jgi:hypothetical protein